MLTLPVLCKFRFTAAKHRYRQKKPSGEGGLRRGVIDRVNYVSESSGVPACVRSLAV